MSWLSHVVKLEFDVNYNNRHVYGIGTLDHHWSSIPSKAWVSDRFSAGAAPAMSELKAPGSDNAMRAKT